MAESKGDPNAVCYNTGNGCSRRPTGLSVDRGGWQINSHAHPNVSPACAYNMECAARAAYVISNKGRTWSPWVTYQRGRHNDYLIRAANAVAALH